jgi:hypothetical protein
MILSASSASATACFGSPVFRAVNERLVSRIIIRGCVVGIEDRDDE